MDKQQIDQLSDLKLEVELLKRDFGYITSLFDKMDKLLEKVRDQQENLLDKTNNLIEQKSRCTKDEIRDIYDTIEETERNILLRISNIEAFVNTDKKTDDEHLTTFFNKLMYLGAGALLVITFIIQHFEELKKLFS